MNILIGRHHSDAYKVWGPPVKKSDDGKDGIIEMYAEQNYVSGRSQRTFHDGFGGVQTYAATPGSVYWTYYYVYSNKQGIVYYWMIKNSQQPPKEMTIYVK